MIYKLCCDTRIIHNEQLCHIVDTDGKEKVKEMFNVLNDVQLSKNFKLSEFECHDGSHEVMLDIRLVEALQRLRVMIGVPIHIAAGYRNPKHNAAVGGSLNSKHMKGEAADIKVTTLTPKMVGLSAQKCGFTGIGVYRFNGQMFNHLDVRESKSYWMDIKGSHNLKAVKTLEEIK